MSRLPPVSFYWYPVLYRCTCGERSTPGLRLFLRLLSRSRFPCGCVVGFEWMVVRFVRVIRVPACARVSRVSRVSEITHRHTFTFTQAIHKSVRVPAPPGVFLSVYL